MERIEEIRARVERLKTPHRVKIDVSGAVDIAGLAPIYGRMSADLEFLLAEVDRQAARIAELEAQLSAPLWVMDGDGVRRKVEEEPYVKARSFEDYVLVEGSENWHVKAADGTLVDTDVRHIQSLAWRSCESDHVLSGGDEFTVTMQTNYPAPSFPYRCKHPKTSIGFGRERTCLECGETV